MARNVSMQDFEKTLAALLEALSFSPNNLPLKKHVAEMLLQAGQIEKAIQYYKEVLAQGDDYDCLMNLGRAYAEQEEAGAALVVWEKALALRPNAADLCLRISKLHLGQNHIQEASAYYQKARALDAQLTDAKYEEQLRKLNNSQAAPTARPESESERIRISNAGDEDDEPAPGDLLERPAITFQNVGGLSELKEHIRMNIIYPFQNPALFRSFGQKIGGGILMYGPPGCGKTFISRATAGECNARFINISINDVLDMWSGNSEKNLHKLFELARRNTPAIIFIDELDAIGGSRQQMHFHHGRILTNQLLSEMDGVVSDNSEVLILGATNSPWFVDSSLRRPGRFDRILFVPPPDLPARVEILQLHLAKRPVENIDYARVAKGMERFSGADIRAVCENATGAVIQEVMKSGRMRSIQTSDLLSALKKVKPSTLEWLATAKNYATYSNESGAYDDILGFFEKNG
jgi:transitional endoplasmic reticulum ATPase